MITPKQLSQLLTGEQLGTARYEGGRFGSVQIFLATDIAPRGTHKLEAILLSLTPFVFDRFLPSLTLWLSPSFPKIVANL